MILAHYRGLLVGCKVLKERDNKVRVKVVDEKRPKWINLAEGKQKLFENTEEAIEWIESHDSK